MSVQQTKCHTLYVATDCRVDHMNCSTSVVVVVVRLEHFHSFIGSLDNHSTASGPEDTET